MKMIAARRRLSFQSGLSWKMHGLMAATAVSNQRVVNGPLQMQIAPCPHLCWALSSSLELVVKLPLASTAARPELGPISGAPLLAIMQSTSITTAQLISVSQENLCNIPHPQHRLIRAC